MPELLAHSERTKRGIPAQTYQDHVTAVRQGAQRNVGAALRYYQGDGRWLAAYAEWAGEFHDLGKLEDENQRVLRGEVRSRNLPINHVDAGTAHLLAQKQKLVEAALVVYSHHLGMADLPEERAKEMRGDETSAALRDPEIKLRTDTVCSILLDRHHQQTACNLKTPIGKAHHLSGLERRILLSCLVDADHSDSARHAGDETDVEVVEPCWDERLAALDQYVSGLASDSPERDRIRRQLYRGCLDSKVECPLVSCESPVGTGKTTAVMAYMLRMARDMGLRHVFVVLPYTSIIRQAVKVYRKALVLPGEDPECVVAAHHHQAEFCTLEARHLTTLWRAPIIVTTAVQFFETLAAAATPALRKLHELPGSAAFIDEAHAAMRIELWPYMWGRLKELGSRWGCRFVLGSGSLVRFWENDRIMRGRPEQIPLLVPESGMRQAEEAEGSRISYRSRTDALTLSQLCEWVGETRGPRVVVMNTVQSAAVVARELRRKGVDTRHLSTALAPIDRERIFDGVKARLADNPKSDFVLVATSCIEAGVDLSFATGFRERSRVTSLIQLGGRVNRHGERGGGLVWDFVCGGDEFNTHPEFTHSRPVVEEVFRNNRWTLAPGDVATYALSEEFKRACGDDAIAELEDAEKVGSYPKVARLTRLIQSDTRLVIVDEEDDEFVRRVRAGKVGARDIREHSVQLWGPRIRNVALPEVIPGSDIFIWRYDYDRELIGVMSGILRLRAIDRARCAIS